ncbi:hypothetical protein [Microbacterium oleivorans]|uniref:Dihydrodipicolinate synthase/N-acetylneuraminate lyase n=1 Tax=Microbacterium oleivorans TaxID=273677 RepID=A0A7D5ITQ4_9MICO|nr:hypothetical protein [Microbacterium oleivorans]QLD12474.1 hypothetical protein HW566_12270 [Microbacterium oleivorans]
MNHALDAVDAVVMPTIMSTDRPTAVAEAIEYRRAFGSKLSHLMLPVTAVELRSVQDHVAAVAESSGYRITLQDYPRPTGVHVDVEVLCAALTSIDVVDAVKEEAPEHTERIRRLSDAGIPTIGGLGGARAEHDLAAGACGLAAGISVPQVLAAALDAWERGASAADAIAPALELIAFETSTSQSVGIRKEHWRRQGIIPNAVVRRAGAGWSTDLETRTSSLLAPWLTDS